MCDYSLSTLSSRPAQEWEEETVTFVRLQNPRGQYRDGVRLRNGVELSLQNLPPGQHLDVLQLSPEIAERGAQDEAAFTQQAFGV